MFLEILRKKYLNIFHLYFGLNSELDKIYNFKVNYIPIKNYYMLKVWE